MATAFLIPSIGGAWAAADDVRYFQQGGVTYREVRQVVQRPLAETRIESRQQTVYREQLSTQVLPSTRTVYTPVTEYRWEPRWHGMLNPFATPYVGYHLVPQTRWETRTEQVQQTVTRREMVPRTETIQVPVTTQRMVNDEIIMRTAVSGLPPLATATSSGTAAVAQRDPVGGMRLDNDPPRDGSGWRSGGTASTQR